jgi:DNA-binding NarL/FixJ family response regulator
MTIQPSITEVPVAEFGKALSIPEPSPGKEAREPGSRLIHAADEDEPAPLEYWWGGSLFPVELIAALIGAGDAGKSFLALALSFAITRETELLGMPARKGSVLWLDAEGMGDENLRRAYRIARGMDLDRPPAGLWFLPVAGSLLNARDNETCLRAVEESNADFIVLDSFAAASFTIDSNSAGEVVGFIKQLRALNKTVLVIDHIAKAYAISSQKAGTSSGSIQKHNQFRSSIELTKAKGGGYHLSHEKGNTTAKRDPITFAMNFTIDTVQFELIDANDPRMEGLESLRSASDRVLEALAEYGDGGATAKTIADQLDITPKTVANLFSTLKAQGQVTKLGKGQWCLR